MEKNYALLPFSWGIIRADYEEDCITGLSWAAPDSTGGTPTALTELVSDQLSEYFAGKRQVFSFPYVLRGTQFQKQVWEALLTIPYGEVRTYGDIARQIGSPKASRAVGMANHCNPMMILVPCHRVVGARGQLTGYAYGLDIKKKLLELEQKTLFTN